MNVMNEPNDQIPKIRFQVGRSPLTDVFADSTGEMATELARERTKWRRLALGAIALYLIFLIALFWSPEWLVLTGPFVLLIIGRFMGIQPLWRTTNGNTQSISKDRVGATLRRNRQGADTAEPFSDRLIEASVFPDGVGRRAAWQLASVLMLAVKQRTQ